MTDLKKSIQCPLCSQGTAGLKFKDSMFFYLCDSCGSDFSDESCCRENMKIKNIVDYEYNDDNEADFLQLFMVFVIILIGTYLLVRKGS